MLRNTVVQRSLCTIELSQNGVIFSFYFLCANIRVDYSASAVFRRIGLISSVLMIPVLKFICYGLWQIKLPCHLLVEV
jgi:hypothetical protein